MTTPTETPPLTPADDAQLERAVQLRMIGVVVAVLATALLLLLALSLTSAARGGRPLFPNFPSPTPPERLISLQVETVAFDTLNSDPAAYLNQLIEVTGDYTPLEVPDCRPLAGPALQWSLVAQSLQLNAVGFERVLRLVEPGTTMTVEGIWRLYEGPVGCGKEPPDGVIWYLAVTRIIAPNPLFGGPSVALTFVPGQPTSPIELVPTAEVTPDLLVTPEGTAEGTLAPTAPVTGPGIATAAPTATQLLVTPLVTPGSPTPEGGTPPPNATPTGTIDPNVTPTTGPGGTAAPPLPTSTTGPGGYPAPSPTSPGGYP
jgi:hypothetical protein